MDLRGVRDVRSLVQPIQFDEGENDGVKVK